jgi:hypothetical protein
MMLGNIPTVSNPSYSGGGVPFTRYSQDGVPEYGAVGYGSWQEAGMVNLGEPTMRVVYDSSVPGAYALAQSIVAIDQAQYNYLPQPGVRSGLPEVGYSAHINGVQIQLYGNNPNIDQSVRNLWASNGWPLISA